MGELYISSLDLGFSWDIHSPSFDNIVSQNTSDLHLIEVINIFLFVLY